MKRLACGDFTINNASELENLSVEKIKNNLIEPEDALNDMYYALVNDEGANKILHGNPVSSFDVVEGNFINDSLVRIYDSGRKLIAICRAGRNATFIKTLVNQNRIESILKPEKVFKRE